MAILNDNFTLRAPVPIDDKKGWWDNTTSEWKPFDSVNHALITVRFYRYRTLTLPVVENGDVVEYWFKEGVEDSDFVIKTSQVDLSNYYTKTELQTPGQSSVHFDNITNVPPFITDVTWNIITGDQSTVNVGGFNNDVGYITSADLPDLSNYLQIGDDVSQLFNDAGYITLADVPTYTFENGLREEDGVVKLGFDAITGEGILTEDLILVKGDVANNDFVAWTLSDASVGITIDGGSVRFNLFKNNSIVLGRDEVSGSQELRFNEDGTIVIRDDNSTGGLGDEGDYSANKTAYSYITKKMLDEVAAIVPTLQQVTNSGNSTSNAIQVTGTQNAVVGTDSAIVRFTGTQAILSAVISGSERGIIALGNGTVGIAAASNGNRLDISASGGARFVTGAGAGTFINAKGADAVSDDDFVTKRQLNALPQTITWADITGDQSVVNISGFNNDAGYITGVDLSGYYTKTELQTSGSAEVHWDNLTNVPSYVPTSRTITAGTGLTGGGNLTANRTISFDTVWGDARYLQSFTETDPTVPEWVKDISETDIANWDAAFSWGNHASAGYALAIRTITAGTGLTGGGNLTANRTISFDTDWGDARYAALSHTHPISDITGLQAALDSKVNTSTTITEGYAMNITGSWAAGWGFAVDSDILDSRYLRKDVNDNNSTFSLTLGGLVTETATVQSNLTLPSLTVNPGTFTYVLTLNDTTNVVEKAVFDISSFGFDVQNAAGVGQFFVPLLSGLRFEGTGDTSISFNSATNTIIINSVPGSGTGGAVTAFNGRDGAVVSIAGDYNTAQVTETTNQYFTQARVRSTPLAGLSTTTNSAILATDTVLQAFGKAQAQINNRVPSTRSITINGSAGNITIGGGNTQDLSANRTWTVNLATAGTAGTYTKVVTDAYGRIIDNESLVAGDIPNLPASKITSGTIATARLGSGTASSSTYLAGDNTWQPFPSIPAGTVTSVGLVMPSIFSVSQSPITTSGTFGVSLLSQSAGLVLASPALTAGIPNFRALASSDIPSLAISKITGLQTALDGKESLSNKVTAFGTVNNTVYPTTQAVVNYVTSQIPAAQTLTFNDPGTVAISGGNSVSVNSVASHSAINNAWSQWADDRQTGLYTFSNTNGSTEFPSTTGRGIFTKRNAGTSTVGSFALWTTNTSTENLYYNIGTGTSTWGGWKIIADRDWVTSQLPANYVTTNTSQTGISGSKEWVGTQRYAPTSQSGLIANTMDIGNATQGVFIRAAQQATNDQSFLLRGYQVSGVQFQLNEGGIDAAGNSTFAGSVNTPLVKSLAGDLLTFQGENTGLMYLNNEGLGIGATPSAARASALQVQGNIWATDAYILGTTNTPIAEFGMDGGAFVRTMGAQSLQLKTNDLQRILISATGTVTISDLSGTGNRMVIASSSGLLSTQAIPSGGSTQTLSLGTAPGSITISGGNTITLDSLSRDLSTLTSSFTTWANALSGGGLYAFSSTTGATQLPVAAGGGIIYKRNNGADPLGAIALYSSATAGNTEIYYRTGSSSTAWDDWKILANQDWTSANFMDLTTAQKAEARKGFTEVRVDIVSGSTGSSASWGYTSVPLSGSYSAMLESDGLGTYLANRTQANIFASLGSSAWPLLQAKSGVESFAHIESRKFWTNGAGVQWAYPYTSSDVVSTLNDKHPLYRIFGTTGVAGDWQTVASREWVHSYGYAASNAPVASLTATDTLGLNQFFRNQGATTSPFASAGVGLNLAYASTRQAQLYLNATTSTTNAFQFRQQTADGVWGPVRTVWHDGNFTPSSYIQTLSNGAGAGSIEISGGNSISLSSLTRLSLSQSLGDWAPTLPFGLQAFANTTGSTAGTEPFPSSTGTGFVHIRSAGNTAGAYSIWKASASTENLYYNLGTGGTAWGGWKIIADRDWVLSQIPSIPTNYVTTNSSQSGLAGNKVWTGSHTFGGPTGLKVIPSSNGSFTTEAGSIELTRNTSGAYIQAFANSSTSSSFVLRAYASSGEQMRLNEGGLTAAGVINATGGNYTGQFNPWVVGGSTISGRDRSGIYYSTIATSSSFYPMMNFKFDNVAARTWSIGGLYNATTPQLRINVYDNAETNNVAIGYLSIDGQAGVTLSSLAGSGNRMVVATSGGSLTTDSIPIVPTNFVTTNSSQSSLTGNKFWEGVHRWTPITGATALASSVAIGFTSGSGVFIQGYQLSSTAASFLLRGYVSGGVQLALNEGGIDIPTGATSTTPGYYIGGNVILGSSSTYALLSAPTSDGIIYLYPNGRGSATNRSIFSATDTTIGTLTGTGTQMVVANASGVLSRQNIPSSYTLPVATATVLGGIELFSNTVQSVAANAVTATASRTYGIQLNSAGQAVVNVPWAAAPTNYVTTNTSQSGLSGNKTWTGTHAFGTNVSVSATLSSNLVDTGGLNVTGVSTFGGISNFSAPASFAQDVDISAGLVVTGAITANRYVSETAASSSTVINMNLAGLQRLTSINTNVLYSLSNNGAGKQVQCTVANTSSDSVTVTVGGAILLGSNIIPANQSAVISVINFGDDQVRYTVISSIG